MKKTILVISSNPANTHSLRLDKELRVIKDTIQKSLMRDQISVQTEWATRTIDLLPALLQSKPWIVHFCGHGEGQSGLVLEDEVENAKTVTSEALAEVFTYLASHVECVVLNACYSKEQANAMVQHINYIIGMSREIADDAAIAFTRGFYTAIGNKEPIKSAYNYGKSQIAIEISRSSVALANSRKITVIGDFQPSETLSEHLIPILFEKDPLTEFTDSRIVNSDSSIKAQETINTAKKEKDTAAVQSYAERQSQSNSISGITFGNGNNAFNFSPVQTQGGSVGVSPNFTQTSIQNSGAETQLAIDALNQLKQAIEQDKDINPLIQEGAKLQVEQLREELKKTAPDKQLVRDKLATIKKGLAGVLSLAEPVTKVASLLAKVLGVLLP